MMNDDILVREGDQKLFRVDTLSHWSYIVAFDGETDSVKWYGPGYVSASKGHTYTVMDTKKGTHGLLAKHGIDWPRAGFYIRNGWILLLDDLITKLIALGWQKQLGQAKEKFGGLRFYADGLNELMEQVIDTAEAQSFNICEQCGRPGERRSTGTWLYTSCENHVRKPRS